MSLLSSGVDSPLHRAATALGEAPGGYGGAVHFPEAVWGEVSAGQGFYHWEWDLPGRSGGHCGTDASECWSVVRKCQHKGKQMLLSREGAACGNTSLGGETRAISRQNWPETMGRMWERVQNSSENKKKKLSATDLFCFSSLAITSSSLFIMTLFLTSREGSNIYVRSKQTVI